MNVFFKLKHYLKPYFIFHPSFKLNPKATELNLNYWLAGYSNLIINNKWTIENGIPLGLYTKDLKLGDEKRTHICALCEFCFGNIELGKDNDTVLSFLNYNLNTEFDKENNLKYSFWKTYIDPFRETYFVHGMGQGQILSLFARYWKITKDPKYLDVLIKVSNSYLVNFKDPNGFVNKQNGISFEEYPKRQKTDPKVLNGWAISLIGLGDYLEVSNNSLDERFEKKKELYNNSVITLAKTMNNYNLFIWSTYAQPRSILNICSIHYHIHHIGLLNVLYHRTNNKVFFKYHIKFLRQFYNPIYRILALFIKLFISNIFKYGRFYKTK
jgi:hypothetical protein